ncbi:MAG: glycoside hydrolase family 65 protein [Lactobacillus sp.]|uniref:glycoside hydrolase family 65 protein n=1 Tax=Bombilactobacillus bombi TaxID=1303590 RepID=UPI0035EBB477|nr:glycoside hydrolase family 65 protein [Lactobacillus sp.]
MKNNTFSNLRLNFFPEPLRKNLSFLESIFSLSNGKFGVRMCSPVSESRGTFINGFYDSKKITYGEKAFGYADNTQTIMNLPNLRHIRIVNTNNISFDTSKLIDVCLNMKTGVLKEDYILTNKLNETIKLKVTSAIDEYKTSYYAVKYKLLPGSYNGKIKITKISNMDVYTNEYNYTDPRKSNSINKTVIKKEFKNDKFYKCLIYTEKSKQFITYAVTCDGYNVLENQYVNLSSSKASKTITYYTFIGDINQNIYHCFKNINFEDIILDNNNYWTNVWNNSLVGFSNDQIKLNCAIMYNIFQLYQSSSINNQLSISAKGLSGDGYEGHYFWDTEMYLVPFFSLNNPKIARNLLKYRYNVLEEAKKRARTLGIKKGALFAWRTINGKEASAYYPAGTAQYHINSDIAYSIDYYYKCTNDIKFIAKYGFEMLLETAKFWKEYSQLDEETGLLKFFTVTGPDEYTVLVDNDYYTNIMAKYNLEIVKNYATRLEDIGYSPESYHTNWQEIEELYQLSKRVYLPYNKKKKISSQDDSFLSKPKWPFNKVSKDNYPLLLHYHPLTIYRYQVAKQPDVLLARSLFPDKVSTEQLKLEYEYYNSVTTHDSSLSKPIFAIIASKLEKKEQAFKYFQESLFLDLFNLQSNTEDGLHMANIAGSWMILTKGFLGIKIEKNILYLQNNLPNKLNHLKIRITFLNALIEINASNRYIKVKLLKGEKIKLIIQKRKVIIDSKHNEVCINTL